MLYTLPNISLDLMMMLTPCLLTDLGGTPRQILRLNMVDPEARERERESQAVSPNWNPPKIEDASVAPWALPAKIL